jgi:opacity protein-like surface antigen
LRPAVSSGVQMGALKALVAFWFTVSVSAAAAQSLPKAPSLEDLEARGGFADERGLYLRADLGVAFQTLAKRPSSFASDVSNVRYGLLDIETARPIGFGIGYRSHDWLRFDLTSEYRSRANLRTTAVYTCGGLTCSDALTGELRSIVTLLNGYFEIGSWYDFTPYIGIGAGIAHHRFGPVTLPPGANIQTGTTTDARARNRLALAAMIGTAYDISERVKLDIGYRYLYAGRIESGTFDCATSGDICNGGTQSLRVGSHELRVGLRVLLQQGPSLMAFNR